MQIPSGFLDLLRTMMTEDECQAFLEAYRQPLGKSGFLLQSRIPLDTNHFFPGWIRNPGAMSLPHHYLIERADRTIALGNTRQHQYGFMYSQELAAGLPARLIPLSAGDRVLDMCAAPGGKSIQILDRLMQLGGGYLWSNEPDRKRAATLHDSLLRCGIPAFCLMNYLGQKIPVDYDDYFDAIVLDAPCSGEGTAFKSLSALSFWRREDINSIVSIQKALITRAISLLRPGGFMTYSTCTINPYENEEIVARALRTFGDQIELCPLTLSGTSLGLAGWGDKRPLTAEQAGSCLRCFPHRQHTGGFFVCLFRKRGVFSGTKKSLITLPILYHQWSNKREKSQREFFYSFCAGFGIDHTILDSVECWLDTKGIVWARHHGCDDYAHCHGIAITKSIRDGYIPLHGFAQVFGMFFAQIGYQPGWMIDCTANRAQTLADHGYADSVGTPNGWYVVCCMNIALTVVKVVDGIAKGKLPHWR